MFLATCLLIVSIATASQSVTIDTCGYAEGDPNKPRTADPGFNCRVDAKNGLWGFCPSTVSVPEDCGLAGVCVDSHSCTDGCGRLTRRTDITTFSCKPTQFCSTVLSIAGRDQSYEYIACGAAAGTGRLLPSPNVASATTTPSSSTSVLSTYVNPSAQRTPTLPNPSAGSAETSIASPTTGPIPISFKQESIKIGAIVGGVLGGLALICLTILGTILIRRKHGAKGKVMTPPDHAHHDRNGFTDNVPLYAHNSEGLQKYYHQDDSHSPVEMYSGPHPVNVEPAELPGHVQHPEAPRQFTRQ